MDRLTLVREGARLLRQLWRARAYAAFVVLCLGLGLASTAVILAVADAYLVRPLPFREPHRLLQVWKIFDTDQSRGVQFFLSPGDFELLRDEVRSLEVAAEQPVDLDLTGMSEPERVSGARVSGNFFSLLGLSPAAGRLLAPDDERTEAAVAVVDAGFARRRYGSVDAALGEVLGVDGQPHAVVGVLASGSALPSGAEVWVPLTRREFEGRLGLGVVARIEAGEPPRAAIEEVRRLGARLIEVDPVRNGSAGLDAEALQRNLVGDLRPTLLALLLAVLLLLGIACANTTCLVLSRARRREAERALQRVLGAGRIRLLVEAMAENGLLAGFAAVFAVLLAALALPFLLSLSPVEAFTFAPIRIDRRIVLLVAALAAGVACVLSLASHLAGGGGEQTLRAGRRLTRAPRALGALVALDILLTTVLLVGAGSMLRTLHRLNRVDPGFEPRGLVTLGVSASPAWSGDHAQRVAFFERVLEEAGTLPGVRTAAAVNKLPMTDPEFYWGFNLEGRPPADPGATETALFRVVTPGYFRALGVPLLAGRTFRQADGAAAPRVVIASRAFAERYFPGDQALGKRLKGGRYDAEGEWAEIVGVVDDVRERGLAQPVVPTLFLPMPQWDRAYLSRMSLLVRSDPAGPSPIPALRERIRAIYREAVLFDVEPLASIVDRSLSRQRFAMSLLSFFALLAMVQAAAGIYGVMAFDVGSRLKEIGIRLALGARPAEVRRWVLRSGLVRGALGLGPGLLAAAGLLRWGQSRWQEMGTGDPSTYVAVAALTAAVVIAAAYLPARRAAAVDPARTLQEE
jgi:putative ABC transport system permease protein